MKRGAAHFALGLLPLWALACITERIVPTYCDIETPCSGQMTCDYRMRKCVVVEDASVGDQDGSVDIGPDLIFARRDGGECMQATSGKAPLDDCLDGIECASLICDDGKCADGTRAVYVNNNDGVTCDSSGLVASGCPSDPFCSLAAGLSAARSLQRNYVVLVGSSNPYQGGFIGIDHPSAAIIVGPGPHASPAATISNGGGSGVAASINSSLTEPGSAAFEFRGVVLQGGVGCSQNGQPIAVSLSRDRLLVLGGYALFSSACTVVMDSTSIQGGGTSAGIPIFVDGGRFIITNNLISNANAPPGKAAIALTNATGNFSFNTVADVTADVLFDCGPAGAVIDNSIVATTSTDAGPPTMPNCTLQNTIVSSSNGLPDFVNAAMGDYHLQNTPASMACCIDKGMRRADASMPPHDFDGVARPYGSALDVGAFEYKP